MDLIERITNLIQPVLEDNSCYLDDIEYVKENNEMYLRIYVDLIDGNLDMDTCVTVSEGISALLDEDDPIENDYYLEVSSPGAEKPLKTFEAVQKSIGKYVYIKLKDPKKGMHEVEGTILNIEDHDITLEYRVKNIKKQIIIDYNNISFIRLAIKF